jgi:cysteine-rich repeat protein
MIVKVTILPTSNTAATITVVNMARMFGFIDQIASLDLVGFVYTLSNVTGIQIGKVDIQTYSSIIGSASPTSTDKWKIYQSNADNQLHGPVFAVPFTNVSKIYRVTTRMELLIDDTSLSADFYNFNL